MDEEQGGNEVPPVARRFLERHRPAENALGSAGRDTGEDNDGDAVTTMTMRPEIRAQLVANW